MAHKTSERMDDGVIRDADKLEADNKQDDEHGFPTAPFQAPSPPTATQRHPAPPTPYTYTYT